MTGVHRWPCSTGQGSGQHSPLGTYTGMSGIVQPPGLLEVRPFSLPQAYLPNVTRSSSSGEKARACTAVSWWERTCRQRPLATSQIRIWQRAAVLPQQEAEAKTCRPEGEWSVETATMPALAEQRVSWDVSCVLNYSHVLLYTVPLDTNKVCTWPSWLSASVEIS